MKITKTKIIGSVILMLLGVGLLPESRDEISWRWALFGDKAADYAGYLASWPDGRHVAEAKSCYDERSWSVAQLLGTIEAYQQYESNVSYGACAS